ncbi:[acyl-carrier-protein] S-malonyltransferase [Cyberlindnera jadinii NRRL Y-1542]|uniref:[acyl-carrier-protein] S-malonyltransferase n=1 Tax=Cyberlindnera jadinii (strain ATCC 18201 / CBS 1600 / BCRC 20928 / JCM 3617 / NBRC 0987 / NRRL Y-1542) TaxID=983966 RepID=A0A1E4S6F0_CYBJN|nr:FabD/lysophospholipase-like protein [Cyberlindnera jadinii NRRL Y-1542]ODV74962.1 FabD/lysophospholipase-like protein [Cyberlindnera jadinii NRRL Y-1542]
MMIRRQLSGIPRVITFPGQGQLIQPALLGQLEPFHNRSKISIPKVLRDRLFQGDPLEFLRSSANLQPSVVYTSLLILELIASNGKPLEGSYLMGHSLGELTCLIANGVIPSELGIHMAHSRGKFMEECCPDKNKYGMTAFIFKHAQGNLEIIKDRVSQYSSLAIANFNCDTQCVVSGELDELATLTKQLKSDIKAKGTKLQVQLPFHNEILADAKRRFRELISTQCDIDKDKKLELPIVSNLTGELSFTHGEALDNFLEDFTRPVLFSKGLQFMLDTDVSFVNIGPNAKVIQALARKMDTKGNLASNINLETQQDLSQLY